MKRYNCPNCGAPIGYSEICQYCGTRLNWIPFTGVKIEIAPKTIIPLKSVVKIPYEHKKLFSAEEYEHFVKDKIIRDVAIILPDYMEFETMYDPVLNAEDTIARLLVCK